MKRLVIVFIGIFIGLIASLTGTGTTLLAHEGREHVRGVVTQVSAQSITVETAPKVTKTLTLSDKTTYRQGGKAAHLADIKVGDRVVIEVPEKTNEAEEIQIAAAAKARSQK